MQWKKSYKSYQKSYFKSIGYFNWHEKLVFLRFEIYVKFRQLVMSRQFITSNCAFQTSAYKIWNLPSIEFGGLVAGKTLDMVNEVDKSRGLSSMTLSISLLNRVVLRYWIAGSRKASSGLSGTKKATNSVLGPTSLMRSKMGSPVGPLVPITLTSSLYTKL